MLGEAIVLDASTDSNYITSSYFDGRSLYITTTAEAAAKQAALQISSGGLAYKYEITDVSAVSAPLGENIGLILAVAIACFIVAIMVAFVLLFKVYGVVFDLSLIWFVCLELLMMIAVPGIKLSLGGIIGIVLATVLTCDAFVVTVKRIKEEFEKGKTLKSAVKVGYSRSLLPVISMGVISGLIALALFAFASGSLQCFGITFGIGAVLGVLVNLLITRMYSAIILSLVKYDEKAVNFKRMEE